MQVSSENPSAPPFPLAAFLMSAGILCEFSIEVYGKGMTKVDLFKCSPLQENITTGQVLKPR